MTTFSAVLTLKLPHRTLETFYVLWITTIWTSISSLMSLGRIKSFLVGWYLMVVFTWVPLVTLWSGLVGMLFPLALDLWEVCSLMSHQIHLSHLGITCNLFYVMCGRLWWLHLLSKLPNFACRKLLQINVRIIDGLGNKFFILEEKPEYISVQDTCSFWWVLGKRHLCLYSIVPLIYWLIALSEAC